MTICTIAIPVYNREHLARAAIESALAQESDDLEILVIDDVSTDGTWEALESFVRETEARYPAGRLRLFRNERNLGLFGNFNRCLERAQGKYVRILCNDDRLMPGSIAREIALMEQYPEAVLLSTRGREVDKDGKLLRIFADEFPAGLYTGEQMIGNVLWLIAHYNSNPLNYPSGILIRRSAAEQAGSFVNTYRLVGDIDYWLRLFTLGDVLIADHVGCDITVHTEQEGYSALMSGKVVEEYYALAAQWQTHLRARGMEAQVQRQLAGLAMYTAARLRWKEKHPEVARLYWQSALRPGFSPWKLLGAAGSFAWRVQTRKRRHTFALPPLSSRPLGTQP